MGRREAGVSMQPSLSHALVIIVIRLLDFVDPTGPDGLVALRSSNMIIQVRHFGGSVFLQVNRLGI